MPLPFVTIAKNSKNNEAPKPAAKLFQTKLLFVKTSRRQTNTNIINIKLSGISWFSKSITKIAIKAGRITKPAGKKKGPIIPRHIKRGEGESGVSAAKVKRPKKIKAKAVENSIRG
jgi:hypothetical protein